MIVGVLKPKMGLLNKRCLIFLWILITTLPSAAEAVILMESSIGFSEIFQLKKWTPFSVFLENKGRLTYGTLEIVVRTGSEYKNNLEETVYTRKVELPSHSRKKYDFTLFIQSSVHPIKINLLENGTLLQTEEFSLKRHYTEKRLVLILGERGNSHLFNAESEQIKPLFVRPQELPETWFSYDGVESVVLQDGVLKNLRKSQLDALAEWIQQGGFLILSGGSNYSFFADEKMKNLVSIRVIGLERVTRLDALQKFSRQGFVSEHPFLILKTKIEGGRPVLEEGSIPLIIEKASGAGKILFLAFDFQSSLFQGWSGNVYFWDWLNAFQPAQTPTIIGLEESAVLQALIASISPQFPVYYLILALLLCYAIVIRFFLIRIQNPKWQRPQIWFLSFILGCSFIGSFVFYYFGQINEVRHSRFTLLTKPVSASVYAQQWIAVYSFSQHKYQMKTDLQPIRLLEAGYAKDLEQERFILEEENGKQTMSVPIRRWSHQFLKTKSSLEFPLEGAFWRDGENLRIVIENKTTFDIKNGMIYFSNHLIPIGELPSKKRKTIALTPAQIEGYETLKVETVRSLVKEWMPENSRGYFNKFQGNIMESILHSLVENYSSKPNRILMIGWLDSDLLTVETDGVAEQISMLEWEILQRVER